jgi:hypothetical protein
LRRRRRFSWEWLRLQQFVVGDSINSSAGKDEKTEKKASRKNHAPKLIRGMALVKKTLVNSP